MKLVKSKILVKLRHGQSKVDNILDSMIQQDMKIWKPGQLLYDPKLACILFGIGAILNFIIASFFLVYYRNPLYDEIISDPITNLTNSFVLNVPRDLPGPVNVNIYFSNFYQNFRSYVQSRPPEIYPGFSCGPATTINYLKNIRGDTLDNYIDTDMEHSTINLDGDAILNPCGLTSLSLYNDEFTISNFDHGNESISLQVGEISISNDFTLFAIPYNKSFWINMTDPHYRIWMHSAWLPDFKMVWGQIIEGLNAGKYVFNMTKNYWPAEHFNAEKRIGIETVSPLGSKNLVAIYFFFFLGSWLTLTILIILIQVIWVYNRTK
ncbi:hypothetical protein ACR3K2_16960 [Cryptosporidium serpentis]